MHPVSAASSILAVCLATLLVADVTARAVSSDSESIQNELDSLRPLYSRNYHLVPEVSHDFHSKRAALPFSGGIYGKRAPLPFSGGIYGKRALPYSGGIYGKRAMDTVRSAISIRAIPYERNGGFFG